MSSFWSDYSKRLAVVCWVAGLALIGLVIFTPPQTVEAKTTVGGYYENDCRPCHNYVEPGTTNDYECKNCHYHLGQGTLFTSPSVSATPGGVLKNVFLPGEFFTTSTTTDGGNAQKNRAGHLAVAVFEGTVEATTATTPSKMQECSKVIPYSQNTRYTRIDVTTAASSRSGQYSWTLRTRASLYDSSPSPTYGGVAHATSTWAPEAADFYQKTHLWKFRTVDVPGGNTFNNTNNMAFTFYVRDYLPSTSYTLSTTGTIGNWLVCGTWPASGTGLPAVDPLPDETGACPVPGQRVYAPSNAQATWTTTPAASDKLLDFKGVYGPAGSTTRTAYTFAHVYSTQPKTLTMTVGYDGSIKVKVNSSQAYSGTRTSLGNVAVSGVKLIPGWNRILVECSERLAGVWKAAVNFGSQADYKVDYYGPGKNWQKTDSDENIVSDNFENAAGVPSMINWTAGIGDQTGWDSTNTTVTVHDSPTSGEVGNVGSCSEHCMKVAVRKTSAGGSHVTAMNEYNTPITTTDTQVVEFDVRLPTNASLSSAATYVAAFYIREAADGPLSSLTNKNPSNGSDWIKVGLQMDGVVRYGSRWFIEKRVGGGSITNIYSEPDKGAAIYGSDPDTSYNGLAREHTINRIRIHFTPTQPGSVVLYNREEKVAEVGNLGLPSGNYYVDLGAYTNCNDDIRSKALEFHRFRIYDENLPMQVTVKPNQTAASGYKIEGYQTEAGDSASDVKETRTSNATGDATFTSSSLFYNHGFFKLYNDSGTRVAAMENPYGSDYPGAHITLWTEKWAQGMGSASMGIPTVLPGSGIFTGDNTGNVHAMNPTSGYHNIWGSTLAYNVGSAVQGRCPAGGVKVTASDTDVVFAPASNGYVYTLRTSNGSLVWSKKLTDADGNIQGGVGAQLDTTMAAGPFNGQNRDAVFVGTYDITTNDTFYALDTTGAAVHWSYTASGNLSEIDGTPAVDYDNKTVYITSKNSTGNSLHALDSTNGSLRWGKALGSISGSPVTDSSNNVYVGTDNGTIYSFNSTGDTTRWTNSDASGSQIRGYPWAAEDGYIYFTDSNGYVHKISQSGGAFHSTWTINGVDFDATGPPLISGNYLYVPAYDSAKIIGKVLKIDKYTAEIVDAFEKEDVTFGYLTLDTNLNRILVGTSNGVVYSIDYRFHDAQ